MSNNLTYLQLLEASQTAFEASKRNLKAAEEAHVAAKAALDAASEAFKASSYKVSINNDDSGIDLDSINEKTSAGRDLEKENADPDEGEKDFIMLSTKKNPAIDIEDDKYPAFLLISSTGPNRGDKLGLYRKTEQMTNFRPVYEQEHDTKGNPC